MLVLFPEVLFSEHQIAKYTSTENLKVEIYICAANHLFLLRFISELFLKQN